MSATLCGTSEVLGEMFEGDFTCALQLSAGVMGCRVQACASADPGARTAIGATKNRIKNDIHP